MDRSCRWGRRKRSGDEWRGWLHNNMHVPNAIEPYIFNCFKKVNLRIFYHNFKKGEVMNIICERKKWTPL